MALFLLATLIALLALGVPVAFALGLTALATILVFGATSVVQLAHSQFAGLDSFVLLAIPFFVLAGNVMVEARLASQLFNFVRAATRSVTGGAAVAGTLASGLFGAMTGSSAASAAALGRVIIPELDRLGYPRAFSAGLFAAGGTLGIMIPPSIIFVIYAALARVSVTEMFIAGILPGLLVLAMLILVTYVIVKRRGWGETGRFSVSEFMNCLREAGLALLMPVIILGGIYGGFFTPTEAAAVAAVYGLVVGIFFYRTIGLAAVARAFSESSKMTASVLLILAQALLIGMLINLAGISSTVASWVTYLDMDMWQFLLVVNLLLLVLGCFLDGVTILAIIIPILLPSVKALGIDVIHFGILVTLNIEIAAISPPVGINLFIISSVSKTPIEAVARGALPFILAMLFSLALVTYVPAISTIFL